MSNLREDAPAQINNAAKNYSKQQKVDSLLNRLLLILLNLNYSPTIFIISFWNTSVLAEKKRYLYLDMKNLMDVLLKTL